MMHAQHPMTGREQKRRDFLQIAMVLAPGLTGNPMGSHAGTPAAMVIDKS